MLIDSRPLAFARDRLVRLLSLERALADIETLHEGGCHCRATHTVH